MSAAEIKNLKIKTGVVKRLAKEKNMYEKEAVIEEEKITKMKADGKDEYDIKKQVEVYNESLAMIPDCKRRLAAAHQDLTKLVEDMGDEHKELAEVKAANEVLEEARPHL